MRSITLCSLAAFLFLSCAPTPGPAGAQGAKGDSGANGAATLFASTAEAAGTNCATGGARLDFGADNNSNGVLDSDEIDGSTYVCNGAAASSTLITTTAEPASANCIRGGRRIDTGVDDNRDGTLAASEIDATTYVCNGDIGQAGTNGRTTLLTTTAEPRGANCKRGGQRVDYGLDDNGDGTLGSTEIDGTTYVCNDRPMWIALEAPAGCVNLNPGNSYPMATTLLVGRGHWVTVVHGDEIDTLAEAQRFDVIVFPSWCTTSGSDFAVFDSVMTAYVTGGGGVVLSGWDLYSSSSIGTQLTAASPMDRGSSFFSGNQTVVPVAGHPITQGLGNFTSTATYLPYGAATRAGATALMRVGATDVSAAWAVGAGRGVFLGPVYLGDFAVYAGQGLLDGTQPSGTEMFLRAVEWAGQDR